MNNDDGVMMMMTKRLYDVIGSMKLLCEENEQ